MPWRSMLAATASAALLAGCGQTTHGGTTRAGTTHAGTTDVGTIHAGTARSGRVLFTRECGVCHTISGTDSPNRQGGDLLRVHLPRRILLQFMREMPVRPKPDSPQLQKVADYVLAVQRGGR